MLEATLRRGALLLEFNCPSTTQLLAHKPGQKLATVQQVCIVNSLVAHRFGGYHLARCK